MSSNTDSCGMPVDQDGEPLEYGVHGGVGGVAPFAISGEVFRELFSGSAKNDGDVASHLESVATRVIPSSSGGVPLVDKVTVEDWCSSDEEPLSPNSAFELCRNNTSATVHAMMKTTKFDRDALFSAKRKLMCALNFLRAKGFSEEAIFADMSRDGLGPNRDEFGLPCRSGASGDNVVGNPLTDKMKSVLGASTDAEVVGDLPTMGAEEVLDDLSKPAVDPGEQNDKKRKTWVDVVKPEISPSLSLDYIPRKPGSMVVSPPRDILLKGNEKFKFSIVGLFSKGSLPFRKVEEFAFKHWKKFGLLHVSQKDSRVFVFRFNSDGGKNAVLSMGTWYIEKRPFLVHSWGSSPGNLTHMPLWVKFDNIPDAYWTQEGLSYLGSAIGKPLAADPLTCKLEILPFAKICVEYHIGDDLPTFLDVEVLDPCSDTLGTQRVMVSYPNRPTVCSGCKTLGHLVGACPKTVRKWVEKKATVVNDELGDGVPEVSKTASKEVKASTSVEGPISPLVEASDPGWQAVPKKFTARCPLSSPGSDVSPSPCNTFKNLTMVDEIDAKRATVEPSGAVLSRSQRKKQRRALKVQGASPSSQS